MLNWTCSKNCLPAAQVCDPELPPKQHRENKKHIQQCRCCQAYLYGDPDDVESTDDVIQPEVIPAPPPSGLPLQKTIWRLYERGFEQVDDRRFLWAVTPGTSTLLGLSIFVQQERPEDEWTCTFVVDTEATWATSECLHEAFSNASFKTAEEAADFAVDELQHCLSSLLVALVDARSPAK